MVVSVKTHVTDDPGDRVYVHCDSSGICKMGSIWLKQLILCLAIVIFKSVFSLWIK